MKDITHYLSLAAILSLGFGLFWIFNFDRQAQMVVTGALSTAYVLWGVVHHHLKKDLHWRIIFEYSAVAILACVVVVFLLLRA